MGAAKNVHSGYTACKKPSMMSPCCGVHDAGVTRNGVSPMSNGKIGMRMLNPTRSMNTVRNTGKMGVARLVGAGVVLMER